MDSFTRDILKNWGLEEFVEAFRDAEINQEALEAFGYLEDKSLINELIRPIGKRFIFLSKLKNHMDLVKMVGEAVLIDSTEDVGALTPSLDIRPELEQYKVDKALPEAIAPSDKNVQGPIVDDTSNGSDTDVNRPIEEPILIEKIENYPGKITTGNKTRVSFPSPIPVLSQFLSTQVANGTLKNHSLVFVKECASFLMSLTDGKPSSSDYQNYSLTLVNKYQVFKDVSVRNPNASLKTRLSHYIRNRRSAEKRVLNPCLSNAGPSKRRRLYDLAVPMVEESTSADRTVSSSKSRDKDSEQLLKELQKVGQSGSLQVKLLLKNTINERKVAVAKSETISAILESFPHLTNFQMIMFDFNLMEIVNLEGMSSSFTRVCTQLATAVGFQLPETESESEKIKLFALIESKIHPRRLKDSRRSISVEASAEGELNAKIGKLQAPCVIAYIDDNLVFDEMVLVAEGQLICHKTAPTAEEAIALLMAAYYVFDRSYPPIYDGFLTFLAKELFQVDENPKYSGSVAYNKFLKQYKSVTQQ